MFYPWSSLNLQVEGHYWIFCVQSGPEVMVDQEQKNLFRRDYDSRQIWPRLKAVWSRCLNRLQRDRDIEAVVGKDEMFSYHNI